MRKYTIPALLAMLVMYLVPLSPSGSEANTSCPSLQEIELASSYRMVFDREPDPQGMQFWLENFDLYPLGHLNATEPGANNIVTWYGRLYDRTPSPEALEFWSSVSRPEALRGIAGSHEAQQVYAQQHGCTLVPEEISVEDAIRLAFPESPQRALEIAWCESRYKLDAVGPDGNDLGLFQVRWSVHHRMLSANGIERADLFTLDGNLRAARLVYEESKAFRSNPWDAWVCNRLV